MISISAFANECSVDLRISGWYNDTNRASLQKKGITATLFTNNPEYIVTTKNVAVSTESCLMMCSFKEKREITMQVETADGIVLATSRRSYYQIFPEQMRMNNEIKDSVVSDLIRRIPSCKKIQKLEAAIQI